MRPTGFAVLLSLLAPLLAPRAASADSIPKLVFDREEHHFGTAAQEKELTTEFTYKNEGGAPITGIRTIADCGCYGVTVSKTDLAPGESGTLKVVFRTLNFTGDVSKRVLVHSNDPARPAITLRLKLEVALGVVVDPGRVNFGEVLLGTVPTKSILVKWKEGVGKAFQLTAVEVPGHEADFEVTREPWEELPWKGTKVTFRFKKAPPLGMYSATAILRTDDADYARLALPLTAQVSGKVYLQSRTITFGWFRHGETKRTTVGVRPFSKEVSLGTVTVNARNGKVEVRLDPDPMGGPGASLLVISVPADAAVGKFEDVVEVHTQVPGEEVTTIEVSGEVLPPVH
jgi:hypothetical protein